MRCAFSRTATGMESNSGWVIGILVQRQGMPRWVNDLMWKLEILGRRQGNPRWSDEPVWWLWRVLGKLEGLGSIHNNKRESLGFEQSMTGAWDGSHRVPANDYGEENETIMRWYMGDSRGRRHTRGSGNPVG